MLCGLALTVLCACSSHSTDEPAQSTKAERNFIVEGNEQYAGGNYTEAEAAYRKALTANPNSAMAQFNLASALLRQDTKMGKNAPAPASPSPEQGEDSQQEQMSKQLQDAVEILKNLAENSTDPQIVSVAAYDLGNISYHQQDYGQAIESYKESLRKNPKFNDARYNLRMAQLKQNDKNKNQNKNQDKNKDKKNQDKDKNKDKNKDKQDKKDQNKNQDKQSQQQQQQQKGGMSQQNMEQILRTMQNQENATQQRVNAARAKQQEGERSRTRNKW